MFNHIPPDADAAERYYYHHQQRALRTAIDRLYGPGAKIQTENPKEILRQIHRKETRPSRERRPKHDHD